MYNRVQREIKERLFIAGYTVSAWVSSLILQRSLQMIERWSIGLNLEREERERIQSVYHRFRISHSSRILELMRKDIEKLEKKKDALEGEE